jgi:hypothetical protein
MKREPTAEEREKIDRAIIDGDRIEATSMYISITECGLTEAQQFIKARTVELQTEHPEKVRKETPLERSVLICVPRRHLLHIPSVPKLHIVV